MNPVTTTTQTIGIHALIVRAVQRLWRSAASGAKVILQQAGPMRAARRSAAPC